MRQPPADPFDDAGVVDEEVERVRVGGGARRRDLGSGRPWSSRLTGTSIFLPVSVRGTAGTAMIVVRDVALRERRRGSRR